MELLEKKYAAAVQAIERLEDFMNKREDPREVAYLTDYSYDDFAMMKRNSLIKCFEFSLDTLWKYLKLFIQERHGVEERSPKMVFRACVKLGLLTPDQGDTTIEMVDGRNMASHIYKEEVADIIAGRLPKYLALMQQCLEASKP